MSDTYSLGWEGIMQIAFLIILWLAYLFWGWSDGVKHNIKHALSGGGEQRGGRFVLLALCVFLTFYIALVFLGSTEAKPWQNTGTVFNAVVFTAGILFTSIKLFPPTFYVAY